MHVGRGLALTAATPYTQSHCKVYEAANGKIERHNSVLLAVQKKIGHGEIFSVAAYA